MFLQPHVCAYGFAQRPTKWKSRAAAIAAESVPSLPACALPTESVRAPCAALAPAPLRPPDAAAAADAAADADVVAADAAASAAAGPLPPPLLRSPGPAAALVPRAREPGNASPA